MYVCTFAFTNSPTAIAQSCPACIRERAIIMPVDPDEQLLLTLKTGTPVNPRPGKVKMQLDYTMPGYSEL